MMTLVGNLLNRALSPIFHLSSTKPLQALACRGFLCQNNNDASSLNTSPVAAKLDHIEDSLEKLRRVLDYPAPIV